MLGSIQEWLVFQLTPLRYARKYFWVLGVSHRHVMQIKDNGAMTYCPKCNGGILDPYDYVIKECEGLKNLKYLNEAVKILPCVD
jgi:hypothetical protein